MNNIEKFKLLVEQISKTYESKNADYGDSFSISVKKYGLVAALTRISDKFNRIENLILHNNNNNNNKVKDESLKDSLLDLASYAIMTAMEIEDKEEPLKYDYGNYNQRNPYGPIEIMYSSTSNTIKPNMENE